MKPAAQQAAPINGATIVETPNAPAAPPVDAAAAYYGLGAPKKGGQPPKDN